mgnify:CR=1 FL=1
MKYRDGYLIADDDVMQLDLEVIEDIAYRVFKDSYLTEEAVKLSYEIFQQEMK